MKKIAIALCFLLGANALFAQQKYDHWSLNLKGGINRAEFDGGNISGGDYRFSLGAELERTFNPLWGIVLDYEYLKYAISTADGSTNEISLLGSLNWANLVSKNRCGNWQKLNFYSRIGGGLSFYNADKTGSTIVIPIAVSLEYDLGRNIAIGLTGERRWHTSNDMGFNYAVQDRAVIWTALANLRIKFGGHKRPHVRNTPVMTYQTPCSSPTESKESYDDAPLKQSVNNNEEAIKHLQDQLDKANADIKRLNNELNNAKADWGKTVPAKSTGVTPNNIPTPENSVEFALGSTVIPLLYHSSLDRMVETMKKHPSLKVMLTGNTDNSGSEEVNEKLSLQRAEAVAAYLMEHGISSNRINVKGSAGTQPIDSNDTTEGRQRNRRVDISFF